MPRRLEETAPHYYIEEAEKALVLAREALERNDYYSLDVAISQSKFAAKEIRRAVKTIKIMADERRIFLDEGGTK